MVNREKAESRTLLTVFAQCLLPGISIRVHPCSSVAKPSVTAGLATLLLLCASVAWPATAPAADRPAFAAALSATPDAAAWRLKLDRFAASAAACIAGDLEPTHTALEQFVRQNLHPDRTDAVVDPAALPALEAATDALFLLEYFPSLTAAGTPPLPPDLVRWLCRDAPRLTQVADLLDPEDDAPGVARVLQTLYRHDPAGRDEWFALILAMAVVWDQPRPELPLQAAPLPYAPDLCNRYDYFRNLYASRKAKIAYARLTPQALTFVVDTPVPVSELTWAQKNVHESLTGWADSYFKIRYDESRLRTDRLVWPHGPYTLAAIRDRGGICTDQAYFATLTARAWGIPALIFIGEGRRGGHAWFAYMKSDTQWEMDVARYAYDKYVTGYTIDPQTQLPLTDHQLEFACNRAFGLPAYRTARRFIKLAARLYQSGEPDTAWVLAREARRQVPLAEEAWSLQQRILIERDDARQLLALLQEKANVFRKYPDTLALIRQQEAVLQQALGKGASASATVKDAARQLQKAGRDDLASQFSLQEARDMAKRGDGTQARRKLESWLKENRKEGQKVLPFVDEYLTLTKDIRQTAEAVQFLDGYLTSMYRQTRADAPLPEEALEFLARLAQAYENNGDTRNAGKLTNRIRGKTHKP